MAPRRENSDARPVSLPISITRRAALPVRIAALRNAAKQREPAGFSGRLFIKSFNSPHQPSSRRPISLIISADQAGLKVISTAIVKAGKALAALISTAERM